MTRPSRLRCFRRRVFRLSTRRRMALAPSLSRSLPDLRKREAGGSDVSAVTVTAGCVTPPNLQTSVCCCPVVSFPFVCGCTIVLTMSSTLDHRLDSLWNIQFSLSAHSPSESESSACKGREHAIIITSFLSIVYLFFL